MATAITSQEELIAQAAANNQPIPPRFQRSATHAAAGSRRTARRLRADTPPPVAGAASSRRTRTRRARRFLRTSSRGRRLRSRRDDSRSERLGGDALGLRLAPAALERRASFARVQLRARRARSARSSSAPAASRRPTSARSAGSSRRPTSAATIVIKILQKGVSDEDAHALPDGEGAPRARPGSPEHHPRSSRSGEGDDTEFIPADIRDKVETEFMILEKLDMSPRGAPQGLARSRRRKKTSSRCRLHERIFRVLDYMIPIASRGRVRAPRSQHLPPRHQARERARRPARSEPPRLDARGAPRRLQRREAPDDEVSFGMTQMKAAVPGTLFFQSPEQETNIIELLVNVQQGSPEVEFFEDFYIQIAKNDTFSLFNRDEQYPVLYADRARKRLMLGTPYRERQRDERPRAHPEERRPPGRHLLARRDVLLFDQRRLREPEDALRRVPQVHRVRARRREQHDRGVPRARVLRHQLAPRAEDRRTAPRSRPPTASSPTSTTSTATASSSTRTSC